MTCQKQEGKYQECHYHRLKVVSAPQIKYQGEDKERHREGKRW
jgi:hypothetical protein